VASKSFRASFEAYEGATYSTTGRPFMSEIDKEPFPKFALYAAAGVIALTITAAAIGRYNTTHAPAASSNIQEPVQRFVDLQFFDEADGSVIVKNAASSETILKIVPGEDAFIRAVMRGFVRDRTARKLGHDTPFRLYLLADTRLIIEDTATKKRIDLRAFGPTQQAAFARLLPAPSPK
jgi:putative photosynthetic complex assembly protein